MLTFYQKYKMPGVSTHTIGRQRRGTKPRPIIFYPDKSTTGSFCHQATSQPITNNPPLRETLSPQNASWRDEHNYNDQDCGITAGRRSLGASMSNPKHDNRHSKPPKSSNGDTCSIHSTKGSENSYLILRKSSPPKEHNVKEKLESLPSSPRHK